MTEAPWVRFEGEKFRDELTKYKMAHHPFKTHPFFADLERGKVPKPVVHAWAKQFYPWLASVPIAMAERFANCSWEPGNDRYRRMILDQLVEEAGDPKGKEPGHPELWLRFCEGLGLLRSEVQGAPLLPSTMVAIDDFLYTNRINTFYVSAAGSSEPPNVELCARLLPAFRQHYGVDEAHLEVLQTARDGGRGAQRMDRTDRRGLCELAGDPQADVGSDAPWFLDPRPARGRRPRPERALCGAGQG